jgi:hypothetical protein
MSHGHPLAVSRLGLVHAAKAENHGIPGRPNPKAFSLVLNSLSYQAQFSRRITPPFFNM